MSQREVWDSIAKPWHCFRRKPREDAAGFLGGMQDSKGIVLDLACGSGRNFTKINGILVGTDFSKNMLKYAKEKTKKEKMNAVLAAADASELPFRDETFSGILFSSSLHCIEKEKMNKCLGEIKRVAKTGSRIFISVWNKHQPRFFLSRKERFMPWRAGDKIYHRYYYLFTENELKCLLGINGFDIISIHGSSDKAFKLFPRNIIAIVEKAS